MRAETLDELLDISSGGDSGEPPPPVKLALDRERIRGKPGQIVRLIWTAENVDHVIVRRLQFDEERSSKLPRAAVEIVLDYLDEWIHITAVGNSGMLTRVCRLEVEIDSLCDVSIDLEPIDLGELR